MIGQVAETFGARVTQVLKAASAAVVLLCTVVFGIASLSDGFKDWLFKGNASPLVVGLIILGTAAVAAAVLLVLMDKLGGQYQRAVDEAEEQRQRTREAADEVEAYKETMTQLRQVVGGLEQLAYYDSITGIPNSNYLKRELSGPESAETLRCLILLDLKNFGEINKKYNHWKGDRYLSRFGRMVEQEARRNEFIMKKRPIVDEGDANKSFDVEDIMAFRKSAGGDEFYILLKGSLIDGLGYLSRLKGRTLEFEKMSADVLGDRHPFDFHAGVIAIAPNEPYQSAMKRVMESLGLAMECPTSGVYWAEREVPRFEPGSIAERTLLNAVATFGDPHAPTIH